MMGPRARRRGTESGGGAPVLFAVGKLEAEGSLGNCRPQSSGIQGERVSILGRQATLRYPTVHCSLSPPLPPCEPVELSPASVSL